MPGKEKMRPVDVEKRIVATYDYMDESGELLYQAVREEPKEFKQRRPDGNGWIWNLEGVRRVLYRLPELLQARPDDWVFIVEGEKDVDRLYDEGLTATTCPMGAGKWDDKYSEFLNDRSRVAIIPDNDDAGRKHSREVTGSLAGVGVKARIIELPGLPEKGDVSDWLDNGGDKSKLLKLIETTKLPESESEWELPAPLGHFNLPIFPLEAFPRQLCVLCAFCEAVAESYQVPVDLPAMLVLSVSGASLAKRVVVHIRADHWEPVNLDATPESVALLLNDNAGRFALLSPEGDVFDLMAGRYSSSGAPNLGVYLKGHAGDDIRVNRANQDFTPRYTHKPALSIGVAVQPEVLRGLTLKKGFRGRGLLGRFLYSLPQSLLGHRKINPCPVDSKIATAYQDKILNALRLEPNIDTDGNPCPHIITVGSDALQEIDRFAMQVEKHLGPGGDFAAMGDWAGKLVGAVCRIAGIFHSLIYATSGNPAKAQIDAETILGAIAIGEYLIPHAKAAFFEMGADPAIDSARRILDWVSSEQIQEFTRREAFNSLRGSIQKVNELDKPLEILINHGYIREVLQEHKGPGRKPSQKYKINPLWLAHNTQNAQNCGADLNSAYCAQFAQKVTL